MDSEMLRNGSGYIDPTPAQAMKNMVYPGEIWTTATGKEVLILKAHGTVCTVLTLLDEEKAGCIEVVSRAKRWCNPLFVTFVTRQNIGGFVKRLRAEDFVDIWARVAEGMGFSADSAREINRLKGENADMREKLRRSALAAQAEKEAMLPYKTMYYDLVDRLNGRVNG